MYDRQDRYYHQAKKDGLRARSAYKLVEIQKKYKIFNNHSNVLDIGCAPGGWLQIVKKYTIGKIVGVDLVQIKSIPGVEFFKGDINDKEMQSKITGKFDVVISDIAPKTSGNKERDQYISYELSRMSFLVAINCLNNNGSFVVKTFQSQDTEDLVKEIKKCFTFVKRYVPNSTRQGSKEVYIVAMKFVSN
jgi:23S rRNA (uridine2552-2'-O)-methyltransferase